MADGTIGLNCGLLRIFGIEVSYSGEIGSISGFIKTCRGFWEVD